MRGPGLDLLVLGRHDPDSLVGLARTAADNDFDRVLYADERFFRDCWTTLGYIAAPGFRTSASAYA